jgi:hypothetical protein
LVPRETSLIRNQWLPAHVHIDDAGVVSRSGHMSTTCTLSVTRRCKPCWRASWYMCASCLPLSAPSHMPPRRGHALPRSMHCGGGISRNPSPIAATLLSRSTNTGNRPASRSPRCMYVCMNYIAVSTLWTLTPPDNWDRCCRRILRRHRHDGRRRCVCVRCKVAKIVLTRRKPEYPGARGTCRAWRTSGLLHRRSATWKALRSASRASASARCFREAF